jgi:molybdopterin synthase sulfur carrier subunit
MTVRVLLFAQLAESTGRRELTLDVAAGTTVAALLRCVEELHPAVAAMRGSVAVAIDERYVPPTFVTRDGDTVALIPPVSGG